MHALLEPLRVGSITCGFCYMLSEYANTLTIYELKITFQNVVPQDFRAFFLNVFLRRKKPRCPRRTFHKKITKFVSFLLSGRSTLVLSNGISFATNAETHAAIVCVGANIFSITHTEIFFL